MNLREKIVALLEAHPTEVFDTNRVIALVDHSNVNGIKTTLAGVCESGLIERVSRGRYRAWPVK